MTQESFQINSAAVSDRGLSKKRPQNEDSYLEMPERGLFAVADGVGGAQAGDVASQMAIEILSEAFTNWKVGGDAEQRMKLAIERANSAVYQTSRDLPQLSTMASTIVALHVEGNIATIGHVGDSRLYRLDSNGRLHRETNDHSVVEEEVRAGRMTPYQAANHPKRNVISRAVGAENSVDVETKTIMFGSNTRFLLCSDGITRHIEDPELRQLLNTHRNPVELCSKLKEICYSRGAEDNLTAVVINVGFDETRQIVLDDAEETTVSTARAMPVAANAAANIFSDSLKNSQTENSQQKEENFEIPTRNFPIEEKSADTQVFNVQNIEQDSVKGESISFQAVKPIERDEKTIRIDHKKGGNFLSGFLKSFAMLLVGSIIGAAVYHFLFNQPAPVKTETAPPPMPQTQTKDIEFSAFETARRNVDGNPELFIGSSNGTQQTAEDFYLLGRAYFLTARFTEAKTAFLKAKEKLPETNDINRKTLQNDIAAGLSIVENTIARNEFLNQKKTIENPAKKDSNSNAQ